MIIGGSLARRLGCWSRWARFPADTLPVLCGQQACLKALKTSLKTRLYTTLLFLGCLGTMIYFVDYSFLVYLFSCSALDHALLHYTVDQRQPGRRSQGEACAFWGCLTLFWLSFLQNAEGFLAQGPLRSPGWQTRQRRRLRWGPGAWVGGAGCPGSSAGSGLRLLMEEMSMEEEGSSLVICTLVPKL